MLSQAPKGAILHCHLDATVDQAFLLKTALSHRPLHMRVPKALSPSNLKSNLPEFRALPPNEYSTAKSLDSVEPGQWVPLIAARDNFDQALGGPEGFDRWVIGSMTINPAEAYGTHNTVVKVRIPT